MKRQHNMPKVENAKTMHKHSSGPYMLTGDGKVKGKKMSKKAKKGKMSDSCY